MSRFSSECTLIDIHTGAVIMFQAEVNFLGQLHHPNLVKLIGYCSEDDQRLLVYEFMPRGSLENHLFRSESLHMLFAYHLLTKSFHKFTLSWKIRFLGCKTSNWSKLYSGPFDAVTYWFGICFHVTSFFSFLNLVYMRLFLDNILNYMRTFNFQCYCALPECWLFHHFNYLYYLQGYCQNRDTNILTSVAISFVIFNVKRMPRFLDDLSIMV